MKPRPIWDNRGVTNPRERSRAIGRYAQESARRALPRHGHLRQTINAESLRHAVNANPFPGPEQWTRGEEQARSVCLRIADELELL